MSESVGSAPITVPDRKPAYTAADKAPVWLLAGMPALLVTLAALTLSWLVIGHFKTQVERDQSDTFETAATTLRERILHRLEEYELWLEGLHAIEEAHPGRGAGGFAAYHNAIRDSRLGRSVAAAWFVRRVPRDELPVFLDRLRFIYPQATGRTDPDSLPDAHIIDFAYTQDPAYARLGQDLSAIPPSLASLETARDRARFTLSAPVSLGIEDDPILLMLRAAYRDASENAPVDDLRRRYLGAAVLATTARQLFRDIADTPALTPLYFEVHDIGNAPGAISVPLHVSGRTDANNYLERDASISVGGRLWRLVIRANATSADAHIEYLLLHTAGLIVSLLLGSLFFVTLRSRFRFARIAERIHLKHQAIETRLRDLAELSSDWFWEQDAQYRFTHFSDNPMLRKDLDIEQTALGKTRWELPICGVSETQWAIHRAQLDQREPFEMQYQIVALDGTTHWFAIRGRPVYDSLGHFSGYRGTGHDITRRMRNQQALEESERRYRDLFQMLPEAMLAHRNHTILLANPEAARLFGFDRVEDLLGGNVMELLAPQDREQATKRAAAILEAGTPVGSQLPPHRLRILQKGRILVEAEVTAARILIHDQPTVLSVFRDIRRQLQAEAVIRASRDQLEKHVAERTAELDEANRELEAFSYSVSHDLRAPLRGIDGFSQLLDERYGAQLDDSGRDYLGRIRKGAQRMSELIDSLLSLSRLSRAELRCKAVDLTALCNELLEEIRASDPERNVATTVQEGLVTNADPAMVRIVFDNLLRNAWKYSGENPNARISVASAATPQGPGIAVGDNGAGFDMQQASKLFTPFQRLHAASRFSGSGIGLAIVHRIVRRHGGQISATSSPGEGATFTLWLPGKAALSAPENHDPGI